MNFFLLDSLVDKADTWLVYAQEFALLIIVIVVLLLIDRAQAEDKKAKEWLKRFLNRRKK